MLIENAHISDIVGNRIDVQFRIGIDKILNSIKRVHCIPLGEIAHFSADSWDQKSLFKDVFPYIEISSIDTTTGCINDIDMVPINEAPSRAKKIVKKDDILISTTRPNRGAICLYKNDYISIASTGFSIIREVNDNILRDYLFEVLRLPISLKQMMIRSSGGNYPAIIESELKKILIPVPSIEIQKEVVRYLWHIKRERTNKRQEVRRLIEGIDDYILKKLDISLKIGNQGSSYYHINYSELIGGRLDVGYYNHSKHGCIMEALKSPQYPSLPLSSLAKDIFQGVGKNETDDDTYVLLKVKNILPGNRIDYSDVEYVKSVPKNKILIDNDIISPFIGEAVRQIKFSIFNKAESNYTVDNNTGVIRLKETINAQYVCEYLCSCLGKRQIERLIGGGGVPFLGSSGAKKLIIVVPPIEIQNEIAKTITSIRSNADVLINEGDALLEEAKQKVEKMIIG